MAVYSRNQFYKWVRDQVISLDKFMSELTSEKSCGEVISADLAPGKARTYGNFVISINKDGDTTIYNTKAGKSGKARRNPTDDLNTDVGLALAWARYNHKEIPLIRTTTEVWKLKVGDVVNLGDNNNFVVLSIVSKVTWENDIAITLMSWNGNKGSFYHNTTNTVVKNKNSLIDVVSYVKF